MVLPRLAYPYVGLFMTWLIVQLTFSLSLAPNARGPLAIILCWLVLPGAYAYGLWKSYRAQAMPSADAKMVRLIFIGLAMLLIVLLPGGGIKSLFYVLVLVQVGFGYTLTSLKSFKSSIAISCILMALTASMRHSEIPLYLTIPLFFTSLVLTFISLQTGSLRESADTHAYISPRKTWLEAAGTILLGLSALGLLLFWLTPLLDIKQRNIWAIDREYLSAYKIIAPINRPGDEQGPAPTPTGQRMSVIVMKAPAKGPSEWLKRLPGPCQGAAKKLTQRLERADDMRDVPPAVMEAMGILLADLAKAYPFWWLGILPMSLLMLLAHPGIRRALRVYLDFLLVSERPEYYRKPAQAVAVARAMDRLCALRGVPRPSHQTWSQYADAQAAMHAPAVREAIQVFARAYDGLRYGASDQACDLGRSYICVMRAWPTKIRQAMLAD